MDEPIIVGIDVGTTKICTLVARVEEDDAIRILGVGIEPSQGMRKGVPVDLRASSQAIARSVEKAEHTSGLEITSALVSLAGSHVASVNSRGVVGVTGRTIDEDDVIRAMEAARAVAIPHNREIIHVIQRGFTVDGQRGIRMPIGMHGYRLEIETHIITAAASTVENLRNCVAQAGVEVNQFVLNPLASAEVVLSETEREMGAIVCDMGGGTTDLAIYIDGDVWHTMVLGVGGDHITSDIAHGLRLPVAQAEEIKKQHGYALREEIDRKRILRDPPLRRRRSRADQPARAGAHHRSPRRRDLQPGAARDQAIGLRRAAARRHGPNGRIQQLAGHPQPGQPGAGPARPACQTREFGRHDRPTLFTGLFDQRGLAELGCLDERISSWRNPRVSTYQGGGLDWENVKNWLRRLLP